MFKKHCSQCLVAKSLSGQLHMNFYRHSTSLETLSATHHAHKDIHDPAQEWQVSAAIVHLQQCKQSTARKTTFQCTIHTVHVLHQLIWVLESFSQQSSQLLGGTEMHAEVSSMWSTGGMSICAAQKTPPPAFTKVFDLFPLTSIKHRSKYLSKNYLIPWQDIPRNGL